MAKFGVDYLSQISSRKREVKDSLHISFEGLAQKVISLREDLVLVCLLLYFASFLFFGFFNWWEYGIFVKSV